MVSVVLHWGWRCFGWVEVGGDLSYFAVSGSHPGPEPEREGGRGGLQFLPISRRGSVE